MGATRTLHVAKPAPPQAGSGRKLRMNGILARNIGMAIVSGKLRPGHVLDNEIEASAHLQVSRNTYREAMRILAAKGLIASQTRTGTRVTETTEWHLLDPDVLAWMFSGRPKQELIHGVFELRSVVEPAAAEMAALRRGNHHLAAMRQALDEMKRFTLEQPQGRAADQAFHAALLAGTCNPFMISLTNGVTAAVDALTQYKQRLNTVTRDPVPDHWQVHDAVADQDPEAARAAMMNLISLAILDMPKEQRPRPSMPRAQTSSGSPT